MDIRKLDTLLQSKLQRHESMVREEELDGIFDGMGVKRRSGAILFKRVLSIFILFVLSVSALYYALYTNGAGSQKSTSGSVDKTYVSENSEPGGSTAQTTDEESSNGKISNELPVIKMENEPSIPAMEKIEFSSVEPVSSIEELKDEDTYLKPQRIQKMSIYPEKRMQWRTCNLLQ